MFFANTLEILNMAHQFIIAKMFLEFAERMQAQSKRCVDT